MKIQPKPFLNHLPKSQIEGDAQRSITTMNLTEGGTPMPKGVNLKDIDIAMVDFVKKLGMSFNGKEMPVFKLFSNQRLNEYAQTWKQTDETKELLLNFLTITRENTAQKGDEIDNIKNIPGDNFWPIYDERALDKNGTEFIRRYSMRQPTMVNLSFSVGLIANKYTTLNSFCQKISTEFNSINSYIFPNGHAMPLFLESLEDESVNETEDYRFFSQTAKMTLKGYIIDEEKDFRVDEIPLRYKVINTIKEEKTAGKKKIQFLG